jgi:hypothetical protein
VVTFAEFKLYPTGSDCFIWDVPDAFFKI